MSTKYIKHPNGRLVQAPRHVLKGGPGAYEIDPDKLKDGWSIATPADLTALAAANQAADEARAKESAREPITLDALAAAIANKINAPAAAPKGK